MQYKPPDNLTAIESALAKVELKETCFSGDTVVDMEGAKFKMHHQKIEMEGPCFVGDTLVLAEVWKSKGVGNDLLPIDQIEVGDRVWSRSEITGEMAYKRVLKVYAHGRSKVSAIGCDYGPEYYEKHGPKANHAILATANHPLWVVGKGWVKVRDLQPGDEFLTYSGVKATFRIANLDAYEFDVFNLEVEDFHTYFVDLEGIWVHNNKV